MIPDLLKQVFFDEAYELIERIRDLTKGYATAPDQGERLAGILRALHTLKGNSGSVELHDVKNAAHELEAFLTRYMGLPGSFGDADVIQFLRAIDQIESRLEAEDQKAPEPPAPPPQQDEAFGIFGEEQRPDRPVPPPRQVAGPAAPSTSEPRPKALAAGETIRIPLDRVQRNFEIISEMFLIRNQLKYHAARLQGGQASVEEFCQAWESLDNSLRKNISELEQLAMNMRLTPIKPLMHRMEKVVRDYTEKFGKDIRVEIEGEETELDKKILDSLSEPLIHLTRNAMDHGIEGTAERQKLGKNPQAVIRFSAAIEGNDVLLSVADDGAGIDDRKVLESARRKGMAVDAVRTSQEALNLIFLPGFSTKDQASDISGRGVGLDAVKTYVETFGGSIDLATEIGMGTIFTLRLPLGMSLISAIIAQANGQTFAVPVAEIVETRKVLVDQISFNGTQSFYHHRDRYIPCFRIGDFLYQHEPACQRAVRGTKVPFFLIKTAQGPVALYADDALHNSEIAVKSIPDNAHRPPCATGVSILPTGEPMFVISLVRLFERTIARQYLGGFSHGNVA